MDTGELFSARDLAGCAVDSNNHIYVIGGNSSVRHNDVWKSTDGDVTWTEIIPNKVYNW